MNFQVSIVIPVYNAGKYLQAAVSSALEQSQVEEVLLIEDGSPDNSLEICKRLVAENSKVKLFQHAGGINKGAGATRNLGLKCAKAPYIAFLDADDYFLSDRFSMTEEMFAKYSDADGVYEAIAVFNERESKKKLFTVLREIKPDKLFHYLLRGTYGHFSTNGITFKKSLLERTGYFNPALKLHQDSELWLRFAFYGRLYAGEIQRPVAMVRRHENNRISHANPSSRLLFWTTVKDHFVTQKISFPDLLLILWKFSKVYGTVNNCSSLFAMLQLLGKHRKKFSGFNQ
jgi:glycosyltransferase involved in cell wall biosynthesis